MYHFVLSLHLKSYSVDILSILMVFVCVIVVVAIKQDTLDVAILSIVKIIALFMKIANVFFVSIIMKYYKF